MEPSHKSKVGQKTSIMSGVPEPAKNKNGVDKIIKQEASSETLFLNQRFKSKIKNNPKNNPITMLGNLTAYGDNPKNKIENFCKTR